MLCTERAWREAGIAAFFLLTIPANTRNRKNAWRTRRVSKSLSIKCDPIDQPAALDPVEGRTWSALYIRVRGRTVTRIWDTKLQEERSLIYLPVFPLADWIVSNWWTLLNEPPPSAELAKFSSTRLPWIKRHCLRSAESGLLLPLLYLFNDRRGIRAE